MAKKKTKAKTYQKRQAQQEAILLAKIIAGLREASDEVKIKISTKRIKDELYKQYGLALSIMTDDAERRKVLAALVGAINSIDQNIVGPEYDHA
jgi:hypothetical protein